MPGAAIRSRQPAARNAQLLSGVRPRGHLERDTTRGRGQFDVGAEHRFPRRERELHVQIETFGAIERMRVDVDIEIEIAVAPAVAALRTFAGNAQLLAVS